MTTFIQTLSIKMQSTECLSKYFWCNVLFSWHISDQNKSDQSGNFEFNILSLTLRNFWVFEILSTTLSLFFLYWNLRINSSFYLCFFLSKLAARSRQNGFYFPNICYTALYFDSFSINESKKLSKWQIYWRLSK